MACTVVNIACWWGEAVHPHRAHPIELSDASKLVLSPHAYGDDSKNPNHPGTPEDLPGTPPAWGPQDLLGTPRNLSRDPQGHHRGALGH